MEEESLKVMQVKPNSKSDLWSRKPPRNVVSKDLEEEI
jgi:hypothetical protein